MRIGIMLSCFLIAGIFLNSSRSFACDAKTKVSVDNGGRFGNWTDFVYCPANSFFAGFAQRIEERQGNGDDTALNAIAFVCRDLTGKKVSEVMAHPGGWGKWGGFVFAPNDHFLTGFSLRVEKYRGGARSDDDTSANEIRFEATNFRTNQKLNNPIYGSNHGEWGEWGRTSSCPANTAICGVQVKFENGCGSGDDTALNDVSFVCCGLPSTR